MSGESNLSAAHAKFLGEASNDLLADVDRGGDLNHDGLPDLLGGAQYNDTAGAEAGAVYVLLGTVSGKQDLGRAYQARVAGEAAGDELGSTVSEAGDVNGDGVDDLVCGARYADNGGTDSGAAYLLYGGGL